MRAAWLSLAGLLLVGAASANEPGPVGVWATEKYNGRAQVYACGAGLCGKILDGDPLRANPDQRDIYNKDPALRTRKVKGMVVFQGYAGGPPEWRGGPFYDPQTGDRSRTGTLKMAGPNTLIVKGCIGPLCRSERWTRVR